MIIVSKIKTDQLSKFVELWNQGRSLLTSSRFKMTIEKAIKGFKARMFNYYGIYNNDNLIGFMLLKKDKNLCFIKHFLIDKNFKRKGLGTILLKKAEEIAKKKKLKLITEVLKKNKKAKEFFLKNNFKLIKFDSKANQYILEKIFN